jgi:hypothetical protein
MASTGPRSSWLVRWQRLLARLGLGRILCDTCQFDWRGACERPERPNALICPDYRKRRGKRRGA